MDKKNTYETKQLEFSGIKRNIKASLLSIQSRDVIGY